MVTSSVTRGVFGVIKALVLDIELIILLPIVARVGIVVPHLTVGILETLVVVSMSIHRVAPASSVVERGGRHRT